MKINVKSKVVAGAISVGLLSGVGFAFANTDAGTALKSWYEVQFKSTVDAIDKDVAIYIDGKKPEVLAKYNGIKNNAETQINSKRDIEIESAKTEISKAKTAHMDAIETTKKDLLAGAGLAFSKAYNEAVAELEQMRLDAIDSAKDDMYNFTEKKGEEALTKVTSDINAAKVVAVTDLKDAIEKAQAELEENLKKNQNNNTQLLKTQVDRKIVILLKEIEGIKNEFVKAQEKLIIAEAEKLENEALAALDEVVSSINK